MKDIFDAYLDYFKFKNNDDFWAWEEVDSWSKSPDNLVKILQLLQACQNNSEIAYVAAGPLSDIFRKHHLQIKTKLCDMIHHNQEMRTAIQCLIFSPTSDEMKTLRDILDRYHLNYASF